MSEEIPLRTCLTCIFNSKCKILQTKIDSDKAFMQITKDWGFDMTMPLEESQKIARYCPEYTSIHAIATMNETKPTIE